MEQRLIYVAEPGYMERLNAAAEAGDIDALYALIRDAAKLLKSIDEEPFADTPLHIAASRGRTDFAMEMVTLMPSYARKLNQNGLSPMHLALQNENTDLVLFLVEHDKDLIRVKGRNGTTSLHYTAAEENLLPLAKFLVACPQCIKDVTNQGDTALHIALKNNKMEAFRVLVGWLRRSTHKDARYLEDLILNRRDNRGNSLLHIAASKGQAWVVRLLLHSQLVDVHTKNKHNLTALDIAIQSGNTEIMKMLRRHVKSKCFLPRVDAFTDHLKKNISIFEMIRIKLKRERKSISSDTRDALLVVFILIATANYDASLSPPGGIWQGQLESNSTIPGIFHAGVDTPNTKSSLPPGLPPTALGTIIMDKYSFHVIGSLNTFALAITFLLILFLFPSGARRLLFLPIVLMFGSYALSLSVITPDRYSSIVDVCMFLLLVTVSYFSTWIGSFIGMRTSKFRREWGSSHII